MQSLNRNSQDYSVRITCAREYHNNALWDTILHAQRSTIGHANNIPTMQLFTGISRNIQSKSYTLSLTECVREFRNHALWDTH